MEPKADIAVIGLAVMGQNLILNMNDHGFTVAAFNRTVSKVDEFLNKEAKGTKVIGAHSLEEMAALLKTPRRVMLMVKAGKPVDEFIEHLLPLLEPGDIIIDGGNSLFEDTIRRTKYVESKGLLYIGTGVSGGEEGARRGPSIMPGGSPAAWPHVKDIFQTIAAKVEDGSPCCDWVGENGAGHFVKMVHNGIEYGDMQLICEAYNLMKTGLGMTADEMHRSSPNGTKANWIPTSSKSPATSSPSKTPTASRWWTRFSTRPAKKAPANGPSSPRRTSASPSPSSPRRSLPAAFPPSRTSALRPPRSSGAPSPRFKATAQESSKTSARRCTPRRSSPMPRATCSCARRPRNTTGTSTTAASP